jgi:hypothetical protein
MIIIYLIHIQRIFSQSQKLMANERFVHKRISLQNTICERSLQNKATHLPIKNNSTRL